MVVDRYREPFLGTFLANHVFIEVGFDFFRSCELGLVLRRCFFGSGHLDLQLTGFNALITDERFRSCKKLCDLGIEFPTEGTRLISFRCFGHRDLNLFFAIVNSFEFNNFQTKGSAGNRHTDFVAFFLSNKRHAHRGGDG